MYKITLDLLSLQRFTSLQEDFYKHHMYCVIYINTLAEPQKEQTPRSKIIMLSSSLLICLVAYKGQLKDKQLL